MCLLVPGKIAGIKDDLATIDYYSEKREARIVEDSGEYSVGDYVIVAGRVVVQKIPKEEAEDALQTYNKAINAP